jgi:hypothetical protein
MGKGFNIFSAIIALIFVWICADNVFVALNDGYTKVAALGVVGLVIWVYIFFSSSLANERINREEEEKKKKENEK